MKIQGFAATILLATSLLAPHAHATLSQDGSEGKAYILNRTQVFHPESSASVEIPEDTTLTVIETKTDARGDELVHVGVDSDSVVLPSDLWIRSSEFGTASLEDAGPGIDVGMDTVDIFKGSKGGRRPMTYCFRYVKLYLMKKGLVHSYLPGSSAWMAKSILPSYGFKRTGRGPGSARVNDVCVYTGGRGGNGHIEVRTPSGWYYGYGYKSTPISLNNHRLIACYSK